MTLKTFPLPLATFFDVLPIATRVFDIPASVDVAETGDGELLMADIGTSLWSGSFELDALSPEEAAEVLPLINLLKRTDASFFVGDPMRLAPRLDPTGTLLGAAAPTIHSIGATMRELRIQGLPAAYKIRPGDLLSFSYGVSPVRYALHECLESQNAAGTGITAMIEVSPPIRPGATAGTAVQLLMPKCKAKLIPSETSLGSAEQSLITGGRIAWRQTLR